MTATSLNSILYRLAQLTLIVPALVTAFVVYMIPSTPIGWFVRVVIIVTTLQLVWIVIKFAVTANVLMGNHKVFCEICRKELIPYASDMVIDLIRDMQKHHCIPAKEE